MDDLHVRVHFGVVHNLAILLLIATPFKNIFSGGFRRWNDASSLSSLDLS